MNTRKSPVVVVLGGLWLVASFLWNAYSAGSDAADIVRERDAIVKWMAFLGTSIWGPLLLVGLGATAYVVDVLRSKTAPSAANWHELEKRFALIKREMEGYRIIDDASGEPTWSVNPARAPEGSRSDGDGAHELERFHAEAGVGDLYVQRLRKQVRPTYRVRRGAPAEDHRLASIAETLHAESGTKGSGIEHGRTHTTVYFERLVQASKTLCARFAARTQG